MDLIVSRSRSKSKNSLERPTANAFLSLLPPQSQQLFVTREMSSDFDIEIYNKMITDVQQNPKFSEYFVSPAH